MKNLLKKIDSPTDLKKLSIEQLPELCAEIREYMISVLADIGGHLGGNLGVVELTTALHYVFNSPDDKLIWDVGHQCYVHKILTGRCKRMSSIRQLNGISGFIKISESEHDIYGAGHASTAISAACGLVASRDLDGDDNQVIPILGDGALTGGMAYEGLNNLGSFKSNALVILNDNSMSISPNVGAISEYLTSMIADQTYNKIKSLVWDLTGKIKGGSQIRELVGKVDESIKSVLVPGVIFEKLGFRYFGPIDGHDVVEMVSVLEKLKDLNGPLLLHVRTLKGKGYKPAEEDHCHLHGVSKFDKVTGKGVSSGAKNPSYTKVFSDAIVKLAEQDEDIVVITAAMPSGTGTSDFAEKFPKRFFDVGIAEQHGVVFASGLSRGGKKPVFAVYSTFLQRAYDPLIHDIALQKLPVILAIDRGGLVGNDGPTHHGCYDLSYLNAIPGMVICAPKDGSELCQLLEMSVKRFDAPIAIRFPRGSIPEAKIETREPFEWGSWEMIKDGSDGCILAVGSMVENTMKALNEIENGKLDIAVINCRFVKPLDLKMLKYLTDSYSRIMTIEEGTLIGGFGSAINDWLTDNNRNQISLLRLGLPDRFIEHGNREDLIVQVGLDSQSIAASALQYFQSEGSHKLKINTTTQETKTVNRIDITAREKQ